MAPGSRVLLSLLSGFLRSHGHPYLVVPPGVPQATASSEIRSKRRHATASPRNTEPPKKPLYAFVHALETQENGTQHSRGKKKYHGVFTTN